MLKTERSQRVLPVAFLLGAGASCEAGIPTAKGFVGSIKKSLHRMIADREDGSKRRVKHEGRWKRDDLKEMRKLLRAWEKQNDGNFDIEVLMEKIQEGLVLRSSGSKSPKKPRLVQKFWDFIGERMRAQFREATPGDVKYLEPLLHLPARASARNEAGRAILKVFSLNYDLVVECLCYAVNIPCDDGFGPVWLDGHNSHRMNPPLEVHLRKLHGSISWHRADGNNGDGRKYFRIPLRSGAKRKKLFANVHCEPFLIFKDDQKQNPPGPARAAIEDFRRTLHSHDLGALVIVGCSLRDNSVTQVVADAMSQNTALRVAIVDPDHDSVRSRLDPHNQNPRITCFPKWHDKEPQLSLFKGKLYQVRRGKPRKWSLGDFLKTNEEFRTWLEPILGSN